MRVLPALRSVFLSCLLSLGFALYVAHWTRAADAQETPNDTSESDAAKAGEGSGEKEYVISPEQEELLADMLGRGAVLEGCQMGNGEVDRTVVNVVYTCPGGEVAIQLVHPSEGPSGATQTARFAITLQNGTPPEGLLTALASRIRSKEDAFEWKVVGGASAPAGLFTRSQQGSDGSTSISVSWVRLGVATLLGIGIVGLILRRWTARKKAR